MNLINCKFGIIYMVLVRFVNSKLALTNLQIFFNFLKNYQDGLGLDQYFWYLLIFNFKLCTLR